MNERLRTVMVRRGVRVEDLADECGVDPKTVDRWISLGRVPHRRHRWATARKLGAEEAYLWPEVLAAAGGRRGDATQAELIEVFPDRASVPRETWLRLLTEAQERIDVLVFSGTFFAQTQPRVARMLRERLSAGVRVRLCFGDPASEAVTVRDREEGLTGTLSAKIRASLTYYREIAGVEGCEVRLHPTTLYASLFRYDDELMINPHAYGEPASANPTLHVRRVDGGTLFEHYTASFERVWDTGMPWLGAEV
nr:helix-turn-helix transcriptional regulator [Micromonospora sp. DSM 115978]